MTDIYYEARRMLQNPAVKAAFRDIRAGLLESFAACDPHDMETMHKIKLELCAVEMVQTKLAEYDYELGERERRER